MAKFKNVVITTILLITALFSLNMFGNNVVADETTPYNVRVEKNASNETFVFWSISDPSENNKKYLDALSIEQIKELKGSGISTNYSDQQFAYFDLSPGFYYGRSLNHSETFPFIFEVPNTPDLNHPIVIYPKEQTATGCVIIQVRIKEDLQKDIAFQIFPVNSQQPIFVKNGHFTPNQKEGTSVVKTDENGQIHIDGLPYGDYILKLKEPIPGYNYEPIHFTVNSPECEHIDVFFSRMQQGMQKFRKVSSLDNDKGLAGAQFKVVRWNGENFTDVTVDANTPYRLTSDEKGYFIVTGLPYGKYYLIEEVAPVDEEVRYQPLKDAVPFMINKYSNQTDQYLAVINHPVEENPGKSNSTNPKQPIIPEELPTKPTNVGLLPEAGGDIVFEISLILVLFALAFLLIYQSSDEDKENFFDKRRNKK